ncbi:MAG TPA: amino acid permease, partial [Saprospiraceae bacterium]|nr:amino acid permease [Saprospiraceae bacterium]
AYGNTVGFLYGWFILFISTSGSIAALAVVCAEHLLYLGNIPNDALFDIPLWGDASYTMTRAGLWGVGITVFLTVINLFGVKIGEWIANLFTGAKLAGLALIILAGWWFVQPEAAAANAASTFVNTPPENLYGAFAVAFVGVLWSYGGWQHASYLAGETQNPQRTVPRAMMLGAAVVTLVYVLANIAYMRLLPLEQIANSKTVAADAMTTIAPWGGKLMAALIALSTFGTTGIYCMTAPRIYYAMARDGIFFQKLADVHPRWRTPVHAILIQSAWSVFLLLFWGTFEDLIEYVTFMDWIGLMLVGTTIFVFRNRQKRAAAGSDAETPSYRTPLFPLTPILFIAICVWFITYTLFDNPVKAWAGIFVVAAGWLAYRFVFKKK